MVQHLQDKVYQLEKELSKVTDEKSKAEESYSSLKQKYEALVKKNEKVEEEVIELRRVTHKLDERAVLPKHVDKGVQTDQGMDICLTALFGLFTLST